MKKCRLIQKGMLLSVIALLIGASILNVRSNLVNASDIMSPESTVSTENTITLTYTVSAPLIRKDAGIDYDRVDIPGLSVAGKPGEPSLPVIGGRVFIPQGKMVSKIEIVGEKELVSGQVKIVPVSQPVPLSHAAEAKDPIPDPLIYTSENPFPEKNVVPTGTYGFRGETIQVFRITPLQYIPAKNTLYYYPKMTVTITLSDSKNSDSFNMLARGSSDDALAVMNMVDNPKDVEKSRDQRTDYDAVAATKSYQLLLITTNELRSGFTRLIAAHNFDGIRTMVRTLGTDIPIGTTNEQTCENIRNYIRQTYLKNGIEYVLIGGDMDIIPSPYLWVNVEGMGLAEFMPSDLYYSCLDGTYDGNQNGFWGEPNDGLNGGDVDLLAEVYVGRACVGNLAEVGHFVNKTLWYMHQQNNPEYLKKVLLVGEYLTGPIQGDNLVLGDWYMDLLINGSDQYEYTTVGLPSSKYTFDKLYDGQWPGFDPYNPYFTGWPASELINRINNGMHIINHLGHSGNFYNMKLYVNDVDALTNNELCFIYSQGCTAGAFDQDAYGYQDCIAEHFTIKTEHGAFAGIWNAREGWFSKQNNDSSSQRLHREFWDAVFGEGKSVISVANQDSKEDTVFLIDGDSTLRWVYYDLNYLGDPTLAFCGQALHADANGPYEVLLNQPVYFHGSAYGGTFPYKNWYWVFGDGTNSKMKNPTHKYTTYGTKSVSLTVTDGSGATNCTHTTVTIRPPTVWVDDDYYSGGLNDGHVWKTDAFDNIQEAVDYVLPGGTVYVHDGMYLGNISIWKTISLRGSDREQTIVDGMQQFHVLKIEANAVNVTGLSLQNSGSQKCGIVTMANLNNILIKGNIMKNNDDGVCLGNSNNPMISDNMLVNNSGDGIKIQMVNYGTISRNILVNNGMGIDLYNSNDLVISGNTIASALMKTNNIGIMLQTSARNTIANNTIANQYHGLTINSFNGIGWQNTIMDNIISHGQDGIYCSSTKKNNITRNIIKENNEYGLSLNQYTRENNIIGNSITNNGVHGMYCNYYFCNNNIIGNTFANNTQYGVYLYAYSGANTFVGNTFTNNTGCGVYMRYSNGNILYHNNFMNTLNAFVYGANSNTWDHGVTDRGNYWNDWPSNPGYPSTYIVDTNNIDHYPFSIPNGWM